MPVFFCFFVFFRKGGVFLGFLSDIAQVNFLRLLFCFTYREKVKTRNFSSFFSFSPFSSKQKKVDIFCFDGNGEKLKKTREISRFDFFAISETKQ